MTSETEEARASNIILFLDKVQEDLAKVLENISAGRPSEDAADELIGRRHCAVSNPMCVSTSNDFREALVRQNDSLQCKKGCLCKVNSQVPSTKLNNLRSRDYFNKKKVASRSSLGEAAQPRTNNNKVALGSWNHFTYYDNLKGSSKVPPPTSLPRFESNSRTNHDENGASSPENEIDIKISIYQRKKSDSKKTASLTPNVSQVVRSKSSGDYFIPQRSSHTTSKPSVHSSEMERKFRDLDELENTVSELIQQYIASHTQGSRNSSPSPKKQTDDELINGLHAKRGEATFIPDSGNSSIDGFAGTPTSSLSSGADSDEEHGQVSSTSSPSSPPFSEFSDTDDSDNSSNTIRRRSNGDVKPPKRREDPSPKTCLKSLHAKLTRISDRQKKSRTSLHIEINQRASARDHISLEVSQELSPQVENKVITLDPPTTVTNNGPVAEGKPMSQPPLTNGHYPHLEDQRSTPPPSYPIEPKVVVLNPRHKSIESQNTAAGEAVWKERKGVHVGEMLPPSLDISAPCRENGGFRGLPTGKLPGMTLEECSEDESCWAPRYASCSRLPTATEVRPLHRTGSDRAPKHGGFFLQRVLRGARRKKGAVGAISEPRDPRHISSGSPFLATSPRLAAKSRSLVGLDFIDYTENSLYQAVPDLPTKQRSYSPLASLSAAQFSALRKLASLRLTALLETHSPAGRSSRPAWAKLIRARRHTQPQYKDKSVFGVPLEVVQQRTGQPLPAAIQAAILHLRRTALSSVGLFRKAGVRTRTMRLRALVESCPELTDLSGLPHPHDLADLVKQYFRELPEPLLTTKLSDTFVDIFHYIPEELQLEALQAAIVLLPDENREVLETLLHFLHEVSEHANENQMSATNLAICFAPSLFRQLNPQALPDPQELGYHRAAFHCLVAMISKYSHLFVVPQDILALCAQTHLPQMKSLDALTLRYDKTWENDLELAFQTLLQEGARPSQHEVSYQKCEEGDALRLWRVWVDIEAPPCEVMHTILGERKKLDSTFLQGKVLLKLGPSTDIYQSLHSAPAPQPLRELCTLRSWRMEDKAWLLVEFSVDFPSGASLSRTVRGFLLDSKFLVQPCGAGKSRVTHLARLDSMGKSVDWYNRNLGHILHAGLTRLKNSFTQFTAGRETKL